MAKQINISISKELADAFDKVCKALNQNKSAVLRKLIADYTAYTAVEKGIDIKAKGK